MSSNNPEDVKLVKPVPSIYDDVKSWYVKNGISTEQFFKETSTELGLESMMNDFAYRKLNKEYWEQRQLRHSEVKVKGHDDIIEYFAENFTEELLEKIGKDKCIEHFDIEVKVEPDDYDERERG